MTTARPDHPAPGTPPDGWSPSPPMARWLATHGDRQPPRLYPEDVAEVTGWTAQPITVGSVYRFNNVGKMHRRLRRPAVPSDLPAPAGHQTRRREWPKRTGPPSPYWWPWQIDPWLAGRRGRGRPPKPSRTTTRTTLTEGEPTHASPRQAAS